MYSEKDQLLPLNILNCSFISGRLGNYHSRAIIYAYFYNQLKVYTVLKLKKVSFTSFHSSGIGTCLHALSDLHDSSSLRNDYVQFIMENIMAEKKNSTY